MAGVTVTRGRWMTRSNRVVEIESSRVDNVPPIPGLPPQAMQIWTGIMKNASGDSEGRHEWTAAGNYRNPQGVTHQHDLVQLIEPWPDPPAAPPQQIIATFERQATLLAPADPRLDQISGIALGTYRALLDFSFNRSEGYTSIQRNFAGWNFASAEEAYPQLREEWEGSIRRTLAKLLQLADRAAAQKTEA